MAIWTTKTGGHYIPEWTIQLLKENGNAVEDNWSTVRIVRDITFNHGPRSIKLTRGDLIERQ